VPLVGGSYSATDESGDARKFTQELACLAAGRGVRLRTGRIDALLAEGGRIAGMQIGSDVLRADAYLVCLGSYSPLLLRPLGIRLALYPLKGYSLTLPVLDERKAFTVSLTDDEHKLVFSRLGERLRIAGTAELNGYSTELNEARCQAILRRALALFPGAGDAGRARFWTGLRPATPSNIPYIGTTSFPNLYLNTGHGTLGWTHACGSGRAIAEIVSGRRPEIDFAFTGASSDRPTAGARGATTAARLRLP
jgi:D-amino-acid dehydrogenase